MKSLNRTLSLVLVLVMVFGLFGVASAATFTDAAKVQYTEAVGVMTGIGAVNGYTDGSFGPTATITREEAAKMITYAILGTTVASKLSVAATGFKDVEATRWSAPYVAFCVSKGIINGMGDGTFAPAANVTGYQMAKMMLCAAGYGAKSEFTGASWELSVAIAGNKYKVFSGTKAADYAKASTREEAALYVFNALTKTPKTTYNKLFDQYQAVSASGTTDKNSDGYLSISEEIYSTLTTETTTINGVVSYRWMLDGKAITGYCEDASVLATSTNGTALAKLVDPSKAEYIGYSAAAYVKVYVNGTIQATASTATGKTANDYSLAELGTSFTTYDNQKGTVIKFLDAGSDSKYDVISITKSNVTQLTTAPVVTKSGITTFVTIPGVVATSTDSKFVVGYDGLAKDDYVMYNTDSNGITFITKCATFTGILQGTNSYANSIMVDGKAYYMSNITGAATAASLASLAGKASTFYTDAAGYVVAASSTTAVTLDNTMYVLNAPTGDAFGSHKAKVVLGDATVTVVSVAKVNGIAPVATGDTGTLNLANLTYYTYTKNTDGSYNLAAIAGQDAAATRTITKGNANFVGNGVYANNTTVFVYINSTTNTVTKYVGISSAPTNTAASVGYLKDTKGYANLVVAVGGTVTDTSASNDYIFAVTPATQIYDTAGNYYMYQAVVNGEIKAINSELAAEMLPGALYSVNAYTNARISGFATLSTDKRVADFNATTGVSRFAFNGTTVAYYVGSATTATGAFIVTDTCKYFIYDSVKCTISAVTAADIAALNGTYKIYGVENASNDTDTRIAQLFVVK